MPKRAPQLDLTDEQRVELQRYSRGRTTPARLVIRAKIVLRAADGLTSQAIAEDLDIGRKTVNLWRHRFAKAGIDGIIKDAPRGAPPSLPPEKVREVLEKTVGERPMNATHWSARTMAQVTGISHASVQRIWRKYGLKPHQTRTFKVSNDPKFEEKLRDVVGLYMSPPDNAIVFSVDEKSQIQALDRTQPGLPMKKGKAGTRTHDYKRNGTTTLFAAMCTLSGYVLSKCMPRHRHQEFLKFLQQIDRAVPDGLDVHLIVDNYATHKHEKVKQWLKRNPRFTLHFVPTSCSWLNLVERFFRDLTVKRIRRDAFPSVRSLIDAIEAYIDLHNEQPKPFVWTKTADEIIAKVERARAALKTPTA
ncbi:MAG: IS630 family transposase [Pseudomonadota bacterium]